MNSREYEAIIKKAFDDNKINNAEYQELKGRSPFTQEKELEKNEVVSFLKKEIELLCDQFLQSTRTYSKEFNNRLLKLYAGLNPCELYFLIEKIFQ